MKNSGANAVGVGPDSDHPTAYAIESVQWHRAALSPVQTSNRELDSLNQLSKKNLGDLKADGAQLICLRLSRENDAEAEDVKLAVCLDEASA